MVGMMDSSRCVNQTTTCGEEEEEEEEAL